MLLKYIRRTFANSVQSKYTTFKMLEAIELQNDYNSSQMTAGVLSICQDSFYDDYKLFGALSTIDLNRNALTPGEFESYVHMNTFPLLYLFSYEFEKHSRFYDEGNAIYEPLLIKHQLVSVNDFINHDLNENNAGHAGLAWILIIRNMYQSLIDGIRYEIIQNVHELKEETKVLNIIHCYLFFEIDELFDEQIEQKLTIFTLRHLFTIEFWNAQWIAHFIEYVLQHLPVSIMDYILTQKLDNQSGFNELEKNSEICARNVFATMKQIVSEKLKRAQNAKLTVSPFSSSQSPNPFVSPLTPKNVDINSSMINYCDDKEQWLNSMLFMSEELRTFYPNSLRSLLLLYNTSPVSHSMIIRLYMEGDPQLISIIVDMNHNYIVWSHLLFDLMCSAILYPEDWMHIFDDTCETFCEFLRERPKKKIDDNGREQLNILFEGFFNLYLTAKGDGGNDNVKELKKIQVGNGSVESEDILDFYSVDIKQVSELIQKCLIGKLEDVKRNMLMWKYQFFGDVFRRVKEKICFVLPNKMLDIC